MYAYKQCRVYKMKNSTVYVTLESLAIILSFSSVDKMEGSFSILKWKRFIYDTPVLFLMP